MPSAKNEIGPCNIIHVPTAGTYALSYDSRLVRTGKDFYDTLRASAQMALRSGQPNLRMPTANEEQQIYVQASIGKRRISDADALRDYFGNNNDNWYAWAHTLTCLRFREADLRKQYSIGDKITAEVIVTDITPYISQIADPKFTRENWKDIIGKINHVKGELAIPYSRGHVIREMHPTLGIFTDIEQKTEHKAPYALHGWLRENLGIPKDLISDHYDVAVGRGCSWHHDEGVSCLDVSASCGRSVALSDDGFRPVRGPDQEI